MTTATAAAVPQLGATAHRRAPRFPDLLRSELTKFTSLRSTWWCLGVMIVLGITYNALVPVILGSTWHKLDPGTQARFKQDTLGLVLQPGAQWAQVAACVLGALLFASEFSTGTARATMLAVPRRTPVLAAKAAVFAAVLLVLGELIAVPSLLLGSVLVKPHSSVALGDAATWRATLLFGVYLALIGLLALSLGALIRRTAAAVSTVLALQFVLPATLSFLPGAVGKHIAQALPAATNVMLGSGTDAQNVYTPWQGLLILVGWSALAYAAAHLSLRSRNV